MEATIIKLMNINILYYLQIVIFGFDKEDVDEVLQFFFKFFAHCYSTVIVVSLLSLLT